MNYLLRKIFLYIYSLTHSWDNIPVVLITGSGRIGTQFMAKWFDTLSNDIYSVHEPHPDMFDLGIIKYRRNKKISKQILKYFRSYQLYHINKNNKRIYIESNPNLLLIIPELQKIFTNLKIIFIKRNFTSYFLSAYNKSPNNTYFNYFYANNDTRNRITAIDMKDNFMNKWKYFSREEKIAWWWWKCNCLIDKYSSSFDNSIVIKFEDLFKNGNYDTLNTIFNFLNLSVEIKYDHKQFNKKKNTNSKLILKNIEDLPVDTIESIFSIINSKCES